MNVDVLKALKSASLLTDQEFDLGYVPTGSFALNRVISGSYKDGFPIGYITQIDGQSSTAKTVFATQALAEAQTLGYYTVLADTENAFSSDFAEVLGIDPTKLIYLAPPTLEDTFDSFEKVIKEIREKDQDTPIVMAFDSIAVCPVRAEMEDDGYKQNNMLGGLRARITGDCLRRFNTLVRDQKIALIVINQLREKIGQMYGDTSTPAGGGKSLPYYLGVGLRTYSAKSEQITDSHKNVIGIQGRVKNTKNKVSIPFRETTFELIFNEGLNPYFGLLDCLVADGLVERNGNWYTLVETGMKFQKKGFENVLLNDDNFEKVRELLGLG